MKIIVLMKQVPNTTNMLIDKEKGTLIRTGVESIMNPDDTNALETALQIKEKNDAHVIVMTMGPTQAEEMLRECYARGADECVLSLIKHLLDQILGLHLIPYLPLSNDTIQI